MSKKRPEKPLARRAYEGPNKMERRWEPIKEYSDILFDFFEGIARITINRPQVRNAFTPVTVAQMSEALTICRQRNDIRVVVLTGAGDKAFCSGGDMHVKGIGGYIDPTGVPRLNVLDVQKQIRSLPKPVIAMVNGFAIGGGHVLQSDPLTPASARAASPAAWVRRRRAKSGACAASTPPRKPSKWDSSTRWFRSISSRTKSSTGQRP